MRNKYIIKITFIALLAVFITSCSTHRLMREPNVRVELNRNDFTLSEQVSAEATTLKVLGIDWERLFNKKSADISKDGKSFTINFAKIPVIGSVFIDKTGNYALYELMQKNEGYDVVFYPQYEKVKKRYILFSKTTVKVTARLGKMK